MFWRERHNDISNAGQWALASRHIDEARHLFRRITLAILRDRLRRYSTRRSQSLIKLVPRGHCRGYRLLVARAFAAVAPARYHTTADSEKHNKIIEWFESHTNFRVIPKQNRHHRASELTAFLARIREFDSSISFGISFPGSCTPCRQT